MRKIIEDQSWLGATDIGAIALDATSRDDIPAILIELQAVWADEAMRAKLFRLLDEHILPGRRRDSGRPGVTAKLKLPKSAKVKSPGGANSFRGACPRNESSPKSHPIPFAEGGSSRMIKLEKIVVLQELKRKGLSISAIARRTGMDRKTVRKLLDRGLAAPIQALIGPGSRRNEAAAHGRELAES